MEAAPQHTAPTVAMETSSKGSNGVAVALQRVSSCLCECEFISDFINYLCVRFVVTQR